MPAPRICLGSLPPPKDLNYRINGGSRVVSYLLRSPLREVLHANDQLRLQQRRGAVFQVRGAARLLLGPLVGWRVRMQVCALTSAML